MNNKILLEEMRTIFSGCDSTIDAMQMSEPLFLKYPHLKELIISYRDSLSYPDNINLMAKVTSLEHVLDAQTKDDALTFKNNLSSRSNDPIYLRALERIVSRKRNIKIGYNERLINKKIISKECPHCGESMKMSDDTVYVICGYPDEHRGYDWKGCCCDWCFSCGKMLCKTWDRDDLNVERNRIHDDICCKTHAKKNGYTYPKNYCNCIKNHNVIRKEYIPEYASDIKF